MDLQDITAILIENGYEKMAEFIDINYELKQKPPPYEENSEKIENRSALWIRNYENFTSSIIQQWNAPENKNLVLLFTLFGGSITFLLLILYSDVNRFAP